MSRTPSPLRERRTLKKLAVPTPIKRLYSADHTLSPQLACHSLTNGNDVAFVFPFEKSIYPPPVLWASKKQLTGVSSYFRAMFEGGFLESENVLVQTSKIVQAYQNDLAKIIADERAKGQPEAVAERADEEDETTCWTTASALYWRPSTAIHYVTVKDASYKTYEALFRWLLTSKIHFAPLKSTKTPSFLPRANPKLIFKLANQLDIKALEQLAADNFADQLTYENVLEELFSPICFTYPTLKQAGMKALQSNWEQIISSGGLDQITSLIKSDDSDTTEIAMLPVEILKMAPKIVCGQTYKSKSGDLETPGKKQVAVSATARSSTPPV